jgi:pSer/pThr/pTyr-binding forkhead associated (FHA) protein
MSSTDQSNVSNERISTSATLQHVDNPDKRYALTQREITIGRALNSTDGIPIATHDTLASRYHATLLLQNGVWTITDHSLNGTRVNEKVLHGSRAVLRDGDYIRIGETFHYIFKELDHTRVNLPNV